MEQMKLLEEKITRNVPGDLQEHILAEMDGVMSASALSLLKDIYYVSYLEFSSPREKQSNGPAARGVPPTEDGVTVRYQQRMGESTLQAAMNYYHIVFAMLDEIKEPEERLHGKDLIEKKIANARKHDLFDEYNSLVESEAGSNDNDPRDDFYETARTEVEGEIEDAVPDPEERHRLDSFSRFRRATSDEPED